MGKDCRLCLKCRKRMLSFYDKMGEITYADMVASFCSVKPSKNDGLPEEICLGCCQKLRDIHEFRLLIERSNFELQKTNQIKRINFASIEDIKCKIELIENDNKDDILNNITEKIIQTNNSTLNYNETVIRKISNFSQTDKKTLSVNDLLQSIKADPDDNYDMIDDAVVDFEPNSYNEIEHALDYDPSDDEWKPIKKIAKKKKVKNKAENKSSQTSQSNPIRPVFLADIRVARNKPEKMQSENLKKSKPKYRKVNVCPYCGIMVSCLKSHCLTHTGVRNFKCDICSKSFYSITLLKQHMLCHSKNKDYKCVKCTAAFVRADSLKKHTAVKHSGEKNHSCHICGKAFFSNHHVTRHLIGVHNSGTKSFSCEQCTMTFVTKYGLKHHLRVHTRERPFKCEICSQPYSYKHDFNRHCLKKHGVFLKRRQVYVMNEEVLVRERALMRHLVLKIRGDVTDDEPLNPFEGPHAVAAFEMAVKAIEDNKIPTEMYL